MARTSARILLTCCTALVGWGTQAHAQKTNTKASSLASTNANAPLASAPEAQVSASQSQATGGVGDIVVTARKRSENQRDVPVSIQTVSGTQLAAAKIVQIIDLQSRVPSLTISTGVTQPFIGIRGFGSGNNQSFEQAVGKFIDNVSYGRDQDARLPLFDIERVEVLKGPQVLLYGNSTTAGALNITTKKPTGHFTANGSVAYEFNQHEVVTQGGVTVPLTPGASLRVSGIYQDLSKGPNYNVATDEHFGQDRNYAGRAILRLTPAPSLEILLKAEYDHIRNKGTVGEGIAQPVVGPPAFLETNLDGRVFSNNDVAPLFQKNFLAINNRTYQADVNLGLLGGTLSSTTAYRKMDVGLASAAGTVQPTFDGFIGYANKQFSEEMRYAGRFHQTDLIIGAFYQNENRRSVTTADFNFAPVLPPFALIFASNQKTKSYSAFADVTQHLTEQLSVEIGARYTYLTKRADQLAGTGNIVPNKRFALGLNVIDPNPAYEPFYQFLAGVPSHAFTGLHFSEKHLQPQAIIQYKVSSKDQIYAKYVRGDKAGGYDIAYQGAPGNFSPEGAHFKPEKAESFELGFKGLALDNRLDFALAAYRTTFTNLQASAYVNNGSVTLVTNVGKARSQGFEAEFHFAPAAGLRITGSGSYTDAKYLDFKGGACTRGQVAATFPGPCSQDLSGTPTSFSSKWSGTFGVDYERPVSDFVLGGGVLVIGRSKYNPTANNEPLLEQRGFAQIDAHLDLKPANGHWSLSVFGRNLTDKRVIEYGSVAPGTVSGLLAYLSRGRQIGVSAGFNF